MGANALKQSGKKWRSLVDEQELNIKMGTCTKCGAEAQIKPYSMSVGDELVCFDCFIACCNKHIGMKKKQEAWDE